MHTKGLYGILSEEVFMGQFDGFTIENNSQRPLVCILKKALYDLKQTLRAWFDKLKNFILSQ